jgi:hypothetical protein
MHPIEQLNRAEKTLRYVAVIDALAVKAGLDPHRHAGSIARLLSRLTQQEWTALAVAAGEHVPSSTTQSALVRAYSARVSLVQEKTKS